MKAASVSGSDLPMEAASRRRGERPQVVGHLLLLLSLLASTSVLGVVYLADSAGEHDGPSQLDPRVAADVLGLRTPSATWVAHLLTFVGSEVVVGAIALLMLGVLLWQRRTERAVLFALAMGGSVFLTVALKLLVRRPRPGAVDVLGPIDNSYSFPSGHTLNSTVLIALAVWLLWRSSSVLRRALLVECGVLLAAGIGASRVYLGYHWVTDVTASWLVALAWLLAVSLAGGPLVRETLRLTDRRLVRRGRDR